MAGGQQIAVKDKASLLARFGDRFGVDADKMMGTLKATVFRGEVSNEQMMMLLVVADQYHLNPFTREIYAFPDAKAGGIVPVVSIDGWLRIINEHPQFACMEIEYAPADTEDAWIDVTITRKDRDKPVTIREYLSECFRKTAPWESHPRRMLRHKTIIQAGRVAFGFAGIYDEDEAQRFANAVDVTPARKMKPKTEPPRSTETIDTTTGEIAANDEPAA